MKSSIIMIIAVLFILTTGLCSYDKVLPVKDPETIIRSAQLLPYTQVQYDWESDSLRMNIYDHVSQSYRIVKSVDGIKWNYSAQINGRVESAARCFDSPIIWYGLLHEYDGATRNYYHKINFSEDNGITWYETPDTLNDGSKWFGEDHTVTYRPDSNKYYLFVREQSSSITQFRKISLVKTKNYTDFSSRKLVFPENANNFYRQSSKDYHKTFYNGTMFSTGPSEYWFYCNVYKLDENLLGNTQDYRDTVGNDNCVWGELMFSKNGENWKRVNDTNAFIPLRNGIRQIFGSPVVIGKNLFIYTFETQVPHLDYNPEAAIWTIERYSLPVKYLREYSN